MSESSKPVLPEKGHYSLSFSALLEAQYLWSTGQKEALAQVAASSHNLDFSNEGTQSIDLSHAGYDLRLLYSDGLPLGAIITDRLVEDTSSCSADLSRYIIRRRSDHFELILQYGSDSRAAKFRTGRCYSSKADSWEKPMAILNHVCLNADNPSAVEPIGYGEEQDLFPDRKNYFRRMYGVYCLREDTRAPNLALETALERRRL